MNSTLIGESQQVNILKREFCRNENAEIIVFMKVSLLIRPEAFLYKIFLTKHFPGSLAQYFSCKNTSSKSFLSPFTTPYKSSRRSSLQGSAKKIHIDFVVTLVVWIVTLVVWVNGLGSFLKGFQGAIHKVTLKQKVENRQ